jgi:hypothetical protein
MVWMGVRTLTWQHLSLAIHDSKPSLKAPIRPRISLKRWQNAQNTSLIGHAAPIADVPWHPAPSPLPMALPQVPLPQPQALDLIDPMTEVTSSARVRGAAAQQMLYLAVMARLPSPFDMPPERNEAKKAPRSSNGLPLFCVFRPMAGRCRNMQPWCRHAQDLLALGQRQTLLAPRWSGDGWLLMRQGGASNALSSGGAPYGPTYGANQIGAVLRYRLVPGSPFKLTAYTRAYGALNGTGERRSQRAFRCASAVGSDHCHGRNAGQPVPVRPDTFAPLGQSGDGNATGCRAERSRRKPMFRPVTLAVCHALYRWTDPG